MALDFVPYHKPGGTGGQEAAGSSPVTRTIMNESRFSNDYIEKRDSSYPGSFTIWGGSAFLYLDAVSQKRPKRKTNIFMRSGNLDTAF